MTSSFPVAEASAGLAAYPEEADTALELVRLADERMYRDKRLHRAAGSLPPAGPREADSG